MIIVGTYSKSNKKYFPLINTMESEEKTIKQAKKQIINEILNDPKTLQAYKNLEIHKIADIDDNMKITNNETKKIISYEELLNEIIESLQKEQKKNDWFNKI